ncbi:hypothetical protein JTE90_015222 [Oedothorax gibbosus]|uniref:Amine oxidase domain-containing protein n=1 Tax=Oedothorax gibbosus TaxID=931172 RepID=A0AAV6V7K2_9ARAC|nr:hypothetical protein JTE90_015222 [Oedothorax gibbosus]
MQYLKTFLSIEVNISTHCHFVSLKMTDCFVEDENNFLMKKIIIIGAGISGLACAKRLREFGFQKVVILEARNRIGGRVHGMKLDSTTLQMGAQWIHGQSNNEIYKLAESNNLIDLEEFEYTKSMRNFSNLAEEERKALTNLFVYLDEKIAQIPKVNPPGTSMQKYLKDQFQIYISDIDHSILEYVQSGFNWYCKVLLELDSCSSLSLVSLNLYHNYEECAGNPGVEVKGGLSSILDIFIKAIPTDWLSINKHVIQIDWSSFQNNHQNIQSTKEIRVICEDKSVYSADHVVVTIPLGCLKKNHHSLFVPPLSKSKEDAIQYLGFGTINKIYLQFDKPFWDGPAIFKVLPHQNKSLEGWTQWINRFAYTPGCSDVLCAWLVGEGAIAMQTVAEDEVVKCCMNILENILKKTLPMPSKIFRTSWNSDNFACGTYSFLSIDCEVNGVSQMTLAEPEYDDDKKHPVLMFAGEATNGSHFATIHGAYETGVREAERIFQFYG